MIKPPLRVEKNRPEAGVLRHKEIGTKKPEMIRQKWRKFGSCLGRGFALKTSCIRFDHGSLNRWLRQTAFVQGI
jgi:hypothetical protein